MTKPKFDIDAALKSLQEGRSLTGKDGILTPLIKQLAEGAMQAEPQNGATSKTMKSLTGGFEIDMPCDRAGTFEPQRPCK